MNEDEYMLLTKEYQDSMEKKDLRRLILLNRKLYAETFKGYLELVNWKIYPNGLSKKLLENVDRELNGALKILKILGEHGMKLSTLYPQVNSEEGNE